MKNQSYSVFVLLLVCDYSFNDF